MSQPSGAVPLPEGLPRSSTTRFVLLILMICAAATFAGYWWLVAGRGDWVGAQIACLDWFGRVDEPDGGATAFNACINSVAFRQEGTILLAPLAMIGISVVLAAASVPVLLRMWGRRQPPPRLRQCFELSLRQVGLKRRPQLVAVRYGARGQARAFGFYPRYWVVTDPLVIAGSDAGLGAVLRHELAHLRSGDVDRARLARYCWGVFLVVLVPALTISVALQASGAWLAVCLRLLVLLALIHVTYQSLLRAREHEADLLAEAAAHPQPAARHGSALAAVLGAHASPRGRSRLLPTFLRAHPTPAQRAAVLEHPELSARLSLMEFLSVAIAGGVMFYEVAFAVGAVAPALPLGAYWITGAIVAAPVCLVTVSALWRHELAGPGPLSRWTVAAAGALMGAGLLAGSQLSPRAATNWEQVRLAPSPALPGNLSVWVIGALGTAALALAAVAGGALFMLWALGLVRKLTSFSLHGKAWRRASVWLAAAVLAVPVGSWFAVWPAGGGQRGRAAGRGDLGSAAGPCPADRAGDHGRRRGRPAVRDDAPAAHHDSPAT